MKAPRRSIRAPKGAGAKAPGKAATSAAKKGAREREHPRAYAAVLGLVRRHTRTAPFKSYLEKLLLELCAIDTTPKSEPAKMREAEDACFRILQRELQGAGSQASLVRVPVKPLIKDHPHFSLLHFTKTAERPAGLTAEEVYEGRSNLLYAAPGRGQKPGLSLALNAHVDVVAPFLPPRSSRGVVYGRGACDDKGPVVAIVGALKVLGRVLEEEGLQLNRDLLAMFVVEEETGGNGSLSLAMDRELRQRYESIMVCECTDLKLHPANRGAVWYRARLEPPAGTSGLELAAFIVEELEKEGAAIRAESAHPLFPQRPVQTCHGIIGPFGEHPSRICGEVSFDIQFERALGAPACPPESGGVEGLVRDCLESGLAAYVGLYGDKTKAVGQATGKPLVARHYDLRRTDSGFQVDVHGATGHMGAIRERDGAITKMAHLVRSLLYSKARLEALAGCRVQLKLSAGPHETKAPDSSAAPPSLLLLEGGQGFVPTHPMDEVMRRLREAAERGAGNYLRRMAGPEDALKVVTVTYEKLHNVAFDGDPDSPSMRNAIAAAKASGIWKEDPVLGWTVSCDARLFASEYPGLPVLTFGPGQLAFAHSDHEQIAVEDIRSAVEFLVLFALRQTGTI